MQIVGHRLDRILGERKGDIDANLTINMDVRVENAEIRELFPGGEKKSGIAFDFIFKADYSGKSSISVEGAILAMGEEKELKKIIKDWKKKKMDPEIDALIKNRILVVGLGKAVPISEGLNLPLPMRMPGRFVPASETEK